LKTVDPSASSSKEPRVETLVVNPSPPPGERHFDPTTAVANDGVDEVDLDADGAQTTNPSVPSRLSLRSMMEIFMTTQVTHRQLLNELLTEIFALRIDFDK